MMNASSKRVAFLCPGTSLPRWQAKAVEQVLAIPGVELAGVGIPLHPQEPGHTTMRSYLQGRSLALISTTALIPTDLSGLLSTAPVMEFGGAMPEVNELIQLAALGVDSIFSFLPWLHRDPLTTHLPIWQFVLNERTVDARGSIPLQLGLFSQTHARARIIDMKGQVGAEIELPLKRTNGALTIDRLLHGASWLPAELLRAGSRDDTKTLINTTNEVENKPFIVDDIRFLLRCELMRMRIERIRSSVVGSWNIGILHQPITALLEEEPNMNVRWLPSPAPGKHRMEPFGYTAADGQLNVLYRKKDSAKQFDTVARLRPKSDSVLKRSRSMLTTQGDLEYPFVIQRPDGPYAIISYPHQGRTELFKIASTNDALDHVKTLLDKALSSPTLINYEDRWWLFGTDPDVPDTVLLAYHSDRFDGPYVAHANNPLKLGNVGTRPAGTMFQRGNELWRPALDPTGPDSTAVVLNKVEVLTPEAFLETAGNRIEGFRGSVYGHGVRTLAAMGDITFIDGVRLATPARTPKQKPRHDTDPDDE